MVGQELSLIPGRYSILLCSIWPGKGHLCCEVSLWGGLQWTVDGTWGEAALSWRGCRAALVLQHSRALLEHQPSPFQGIPCPALPFQLLCTGIQGTSCSLKVAQAKHKTQLKDLIADCTYWTWKFVAFNYSVGVFLGYFFSTDALKASSEWFFGVSSAILYMWNLSVILKKVVAPLLSRCFSLTACF